MKKILMAGCIFLAACSQGEASKTEDAPAAPQGLMEQAQALPLEQQPVFAWQQLSLRTDLEPACTSVRRSEAKGIVPAGVAPGSIYAGHEGAMAFAIQCGAQLTTVHDDPHQHWLVVLQSGATDAAISNCADAQGFDRCNGPIPRAAPAAP